MFGTDLRGASWTAGTIEVNRPVVMGFGVALSALWGSLFCAITK